jgi:hypothetical protein
MRRKPIMARIVFGLFGLLLICSGTPAMSGIKCVPGDSGKAICSEDQQDFVIKKEPKEPKPPKEPKQPK